MSNELLLLLSVALIYGLLLLWYWLFGEKAMYGWTVFATIAANIEVMVLIEAFGAEMTLGNVMFASTFLTTDILSETVGKKAAKKAVNIGILTSISFIFVSQFWRLFTPSAHDFAFLSLDTLFKSTPRIMLSGLIVYAIVQRFDVWAYHKIWKLTEEKSQSRKKFLWLRNNLATLVSQLINAVLFSFMAFYGVYSLSAVISITLTSFLIFIATSAADTPFIYIARRIYARKNGIKTV